MMVMNGQEESVIKLLRAILRCPGIYLQELEKATRNLDQDKR
jgi:hypothetical protein